MILKLNKGGKFDPCHAGLWTKSFHQTGVKMIDSFGLFGYFFIS